MVSKYILIMPERFWGLSHHKFLLATTAFTTFFWPLFTLFMFTGPQIDFLSQWQFDKIAHFGAGIFIAGLLFVLFGVTKKSRIVYFALFIGILWEIWEVFFLPDQFRRFRYVFMWWFTDTIFDIIAGVLGAYFWVELRDTAGLPR